MANHLCCCVNVSLHGTLLTKTALTCTAALIRTWYAAGDGQSTSSEDRARLAVGALVQWPSCEAPYHLLLCEPPSDWANGEARNSWDSLVRSIGRCRPRLLNTERIGSQSNMRMCVRTPSLGQPCGAQSHWGVTPCHPLGSSQGGQKVARPRSSSA